MSELHVYPGQSIQTAINTAINGDSVIVHPGTYIERITFAGKNITVRSENPNDWAVVAATIINGNAGGRVVTFNSGEINLSILDGLTITNGNDLLGAGIFISSTYPIIRRCRIINNYAANTGKGVGVYCAGPYTPLIDQCIISGNNGVSNIWGAGVYLSDANTAATIRNCLIVNNGVGSAAGAGIYSKSGSASILNNVICNNLATHGIYQRENSGTIVKNCIIRNNAGAEIYTYSCTITVSYSNVEGGYTGTDNIDADPLFIGGGDYHLQTGSPCVDKGTNTGAPAYDLDGVVRPQDGDRNGIATCDMGAYELLPATIYDETSASVSISSMVGISETDSGSIIATSSITSHDGLVLPETGITLTATSGLSSYDSLTLGEAGRSLTLVAGVTSDDEVRLIVPMTAISEITIIAILMINEGSHGLALNCNKIKCFDYIRRKRMSRPVLPDVYINIRDGGLGLAGENAAGLHAKVGACSLGTVDTVIALSDADQIAAALGVGPLADACLDSFNAGSRIIYAVPCAKDAGEVGAITEGEGNTGTGTFNATGSPLNAYDVQVEILTSGAVGTATFKYSLYSLNGGQTWSKAITTAATYAVPGTGITLAFTNAGEEEEESFIDGDTFSFTTTAPAATSDGVLAAVDVLLDSSYNFEFIHVVGAFDSSVWAALDSKADEAATKYRYIHFVTEAAGPEDEDTVDDWVADLQAEAEDFASTRVSVVAGRMSITNTITGVVTERNGAAIYAGHLCSLPKVNISPGRVIDGSLPSVNTLAPTGINDGHIAALDGARFVTFRKFIGLNGFYITNGRIMAEEISDFRFVETRRVMDKACGECRLAALRFEHAEANEAGLAALKAFVEAPLNRMIGNQEITSAEVVIPPQDIIGTSEIKVKIRIVPVGIIRWIELDVGLTNPFVTTD